MDAVHMTSALILTAQERQQVIQWVVELCNIETRDIAIRELSVRRERVHDLAPILWFTTGTIASLLFEIVSSYQYLNPPNMTYQITNRICNALSLFQCVAAHPSTRLQFIRAQIPLYMYPFLNNSNICRHFEQLRLTSLGVIGALVKVNSESEIEEEIVEFLLSSEIIPICLRIMEIGFELTKTVSTFILQNILMNKSGLEYVCLTYDRFSHVALILGKIVLTLKIEPSTRLLRHVVGCYVRLSENPRACKALRQCLSGQLEEMAAFTSCHTDKTTATWIAMLKKNLESVMTSMDTS